MVYNKAVITLLNIFLKGKEMDTEIKEAISGGDSLAIARAVVDVLVEKRGIDVRMYDVCESSSITDYYVVATGRSANNTTALAGYVTDKLSLLGVFEKHIEGRAGGNWVLVDYGDVIVHIFDKESREFYNFDRLMPGEAQVDISDIVAAVDERLQVSKKIEKED